MRGLIFKRRSVRTFIDKQIEKEKIEEIVRAGQLAPSAMGVFPWEIVVTQDREKMDRVTEVTHIQSLQKMPERFLWYAEI